VKYALLAALVATMALMSCTDDDPIVGSPPSDEDQAPDIGFTAMVISDEEQGMINEKLTLITEYYADKEPDHFLILVGNKEKLLDDISCNSHDQAVVEKMLSGGNPRFLHLAPKEAIAEGALNQKYADAPDNIKAAIDYVNQFSSNVGALSDYIWSERTSQIMFNFTNRELGIVQGECQDLGVHHLGLFKNVPEVVTAMNNAGYGVATWNGLPVYARDNPSVWKWYGAVILGNDDSIREALFSFLKEVPFIIARTYSQEEIIVLCVVFGTLTLWVGSVTYRVGRYMCRKWGEGSKWR
jgi:hypothetical protein